MNEEKGMVSQEAVAATSADTGSIMPLAADLSKTQDVTKVSEVSTINSTDQFYMNQSGKFVQVDYSKLADAILGKISSKTYSLDQGTKTLIAAINELNSKTLTAYDVGRVGQSNSAYYNSEESNNILKNMFQEITEYRYFSGIFWAKRTEEALSPALWRIDGLKNTDSSGYVKISTYANGYTEHIFSSTSGNWSWVS